MIEHLPRKDHQTDVVIKGFTAFGEWEHWLKTIREGRVPETQTIQISGEPKSFYRPTLIEVKFKFPIPNELKRLWSRPGHMDGKGSNYWDDDREFLEWIKK